LFPDKRREGYAFLLDIGFLTSSISVVYGNGIVREETFDCGVGMILTSLMEKLSVEYEIAEEILTTANVSGGTLPRELLWTSENGEISFPVQTINDVIKYDLDVLCEKVDEFFQMHYREKNVAFAVNPIGVTGEGINAVAGASEHIAKRLNRLTEIVYPDLPYYDKPTYSSRIALISMAFADEQKKGWWKKIFNFGGKKK
jgi:cell division ATPase FtsA